ncbi:type IV secretory system conjugative DNA transfer family protein [Vibrio cincinnatiensis]
MEQFLSVFERTWHTITSTFIWMWSITEPAWKALGQSEYLEPIYSYFYVLQESPILFCILFIFLVFVASFLNRVSKSCSGDSSFLLNSIRNLSGLSFLLFTILVVAAPISLVVVHETLEPVVFQHTNRAYLELFNHFFSFIFDSAWYVLFAAVIASWCAKYFVSKKIEPRLNQFVVKGSKKNYRDEDQASTVDNVDNFMPKAKAFKPQKYFQKAAKASSIFFGLDASNESVFVPLNKFRSSNLQIMGAPGTGKGVQAGVVLSQSIHCGDTVLSFDPKNDRFCKHVLNYACQSSGKTFTYIDLNQGMQAQINPLFGANPYQITELFTAAFGLGRKGSDSDFYRNSDREAARVMANSGYESIREMHDYAHEILGDELAKKAEGFLSQLKELALISSIQTRKGLNLVELIERGGAVHIVGSMRDESVLMLQKMLFVRVVQIVENRDRHNARHVTAFLDEFKYLLSAPAVNALGTVRDKGMNILLAHQSLGDLEQCGNDLNPKAVATNVIDNCQLRWIYRTTIKDTAQWAASQTGVKNVDVESRTIETNESNSELVSSERRVMKREHDYIDVNTIQHLKDRTAVCVGLDRATLAYTYHIDVQELNYPLFSAEPVPVRDVARELAGFVQKELEVVPIVENITPQLNPASKQEQRIEDPFL